MKYTLTHLIVVLLLIATSPIYAFDLNQKGLEFGNISFITAGDGSNQRVTGEEKLILQEGDAVLILNSYGATSTGNGVGFEFSVEKEGSTVNINNTKDLYFVGPAEISLRFYQSTSFNGTTVSLFMDYAVLRKDAATSSSYVTVPSNPSGNFEVKLQTSNDLSTWSSTTPGIFPYADNAKFFRLVIE